MSRHFQGYTLLGYIVFYTGCIYFQVMNPSIQKDLFTLEKQERAMNLKFGVIYAKESQMTDDEFLSNQEGSKDFYNFLDLLGERINLKVGRNVVVIFRPKYPDFGMFQDSMVNFVFNICRAGTATMEV